MIRIIRRYYKWNFLNSSTFEVQTELTVKIENKPDLIFLPSGSYRGDLKVTNSNNDELIILSDEEFEKFTGVPMSEFKKTYIEKTSVGANKEQKEILFKNYRVIAVLLPETKKDDYYDKITMSWISEYTNDGKVGNVETVELPTFIHRYDLNNNQKCAVYVSVKTVEPYRIFSDLNFSNLFNLDFNTDFSEILNEPTHKIYRLKETTDNQLILFTIQLAISNHIIDWARFSFVGSVLVPFFIISLTLYYQKVPTFSFEILAGLIAFLIGQKTLIFKDAKLMRNWNHSHLGVTIGISILTLVLIYFISLGLIDQTQIIYGR